MSLKNIVRIVVAFFALLFAAFFINAMVVTVGSSEIVVRQGLLDGKLTVWTEQGPKCACLGTITKYPRAKQFWFSEKPNEGNKTDESIKVRFNDGGHAQLSGSLQYVYPLDYDKVIKIHRTYGSSGAVDHELIKQAVTKAVYMTGPLMSSKESNAEKRPEVLGFIQDQVQHGVYRTATEYIKMPDPITGQEKTMAVVKLVQDPKAWGGLAREEVSPVEIFGIGVANVTINSITYDATVEAQIQAQQKALMDVQTAQAEARKAEQRALTVAKEGEAEAAKAKWAQEAIKAKAVTEAEQQRDVSKLNLEAAEFNKKATIAQGEGEAEAAKLKMSANGALEQKLTAWTEVNKTFAVEFAKQRWVPEIQMGGSSGSGNNAADLIGLLQAKTAKDLALEMKMNAGAGAVKK
jgi:regulator of protease activity HflC (stomatin/prohibitin superfamily)